MRLTSTGLGIGTSSPAEKLDVRSSSNAIGNFQSSNASGYAGINAINGSRSWYAGIRADASNGFGIRDETAGATRLLIDSSGNLGLGVTPSAWTSTYRAFQVGLSSSLVGISNDTQTHLTTNARFDGTNWIYISTSPASRYMQDNNVHKWFNAASGSSGTNVSFTQAMTLDASGNLGVGTTSPQRRFVVSLAGAQGLEFGAGTGASSGNELLNYNRSTSAYIPFTALSSTYTFYTGTSGSTRAVDIDSSGNLLVGTSSAITTLTVRPPEGGGIALQRPTTTGTHLLISTTAGGVSPNYTTTYDTTNNDMRFSTAEGGGTGGTISFLTGTSSTPVERARIDSAGQMIIGSTSVGRGDKLTVVGAGSSATVTSNVRALLAVESDTATAQNVGGAISLGGNYDGGRTQYGAIGGFKESTTASEYGGYLAFFTRPNGDLTRERARIDSSGNLLVGATSNLASALLYLEKGGGDWKFAINDTNAGTQSFTTYRYNNTGIGSITGNNTATSYNTSSDYRLKNTIAPMTGALAKVALLKPCTYKWNVDGSDGEGFIAHELAEVVPECVTGEKDAVDADGNPKYQGIDTSFLVATLTAAIQEQQAIIESLKARLDAANL
jgi:hypothetical protein